MEEKQPTSASRFESFEALEKAYLALEEEITRRNEKIEALEKAGAERERQVKAELDRARSVPLMTEGGTGVSAPPLRARSLEEAGKLALGYFKKN